MADTVDTTPAKHPSGSVILDGRFASLTGVLPEHAPDMYAQVGGLERSSLFDYMFFGPFSSLVDYNEQTTREFAREDRVFYSILSKDRSQLGKPLGFCALLNINTTHKTIEVGVILYSPFLQRTAAATEAMYLLARYVFDDLGYRRYEWTCNSRNVPSANAALRLGFIYEGTLRQHKFQRGKSRDSKCFSMLDKEWPSRREALEKWLDEDNFDTQGQQKRKLETFRSDNWA